MAANLTELIKAPAPGHGGDDTSGTGPPPASLRVADMIGEKAAGRALTEAQVTRLVAAVADDTMDPTQLGAFLMAVFIKGMNQAETVALATAMKNSGSVLEWPKEWAVGDKHSTGGVGDKVSLPLTPALAACGLKVPMISGRGLGHTGGTLDKLESIPGFSVSLTQQQLTEALQTVGCAITGQTADIAPADKRMYAARDVTSTVASQPLIVSSILSKKAAESLSALVLDVKFGCGSFMKTLEEAEALAEALVGTMRAMGVRTTALLTAMDSPIGRTIGNSLEVQEALECLRGGGPTDLRELVVALGGALLASCGLRPTPAEGRQSIAEALKDGSALATFRRMIKAQGVDEGTATALCSSTPSDTSILPRAKHTTSLRAPQAGVIVGQDALSLAEISSALGAGRTRAGEPILYEVGIYLDKVVGEAVSSGEVWATLHHQQEVVPEALLKKARDALTVDPKGTPVDPPSRVVKTVS